MTLTAALLETIASAIRVNPSAANLRVQFPDFHFTECSEDDISPRIQSALTLENHLLYLVSGKSGHCLAFTNDLASATGIVVAARTDEE